MLEFREIFLNALTHLQSKYGVTFWRYFDTFQYTAPTHQARVMAVAFLDTHYHTLRKLMPLLTPDAPSKSCAIKLALEYVRKPCERTITIEEYGCVRCQKHHREGDANYTDHLYFQSKHGTRSVEVYAAIMECAAVNGIKARV